jgi:hypothetical protein
MAQPLQVTSQSPNNLYVVIDNSAPGSTSAATPGMGGLDPTSEPQGFDTNTPAYLGGAIAQNQNKFSNGNLPDSVSKATNISVTPIGGPSQASNIQFRNPA